MKEFLLSNINGGYVNLATDGSVQRTYAGYLTASFHAPQDRYVIMDDVHEEIIADGEETVLQCTAFDNSGVPYFTFADDRLTYTKSIVPARYENMVLVQYRFTAVSTDTTVRIRPQITFRHPDTAASLQDVRFDTAVEENCIRLIPETDRYAAEGHIIYLVADYSDNMRLIDRTVAGLRYPADERTGFRGEGHAYIPCEYEMILAPGEEAAFSFACGACVEADESFPCRLRDFVNSDAEDRLRDYLASFDNDVPVTGDKLLDDMRCRLTRMADNFIVRRESTGYKTILAGYPWFLDWGRDTMISFTGLTLTTRRFSDAREILLSFNRYISHGMLPNVFPYNSECEPMYNTVDASLWYFRAIDRFIDYTGDVDLVKAELFEGMRSIISLYSRSKQQLQKASEEDHCYGIYMDNEGLIHAGEDDSDQLTWMDVRIDGRAVTPRHGCPVEIQALWRSAVEVYGRVSGQDALYRKIKKVLDATDIWEQIYHDRDKHCLYDVVEGEPGKRSFDDRIRPNQLWAVALPDTGISDGLAREIVDTCTDKLLVTLGLRSLAPDEEGYIGTYEGELISRDRAYHMGTSWGFLIEPYVEAYLRAYGDGSKVREHLRCLLTAYREHIDEGCLDGVAEVFDGDSPREGKGCFSQAWSVSALLRVIEVLS